MQNELFSQLQPRPDDPILGLNEVFQKDERPEKVNLTVGAYLTDAGVMPLLSTVEEATKRVLARREPHAYIPMSGLPAYNEGVRRLLFGSERAPLLSETAATVQQMCVFSRAAYSASVRLRTAPQMSLPPRLSVQCAAFSPGGSFAHWK